MKKLIEGIVEFRKQLTPEKKALYRKLTEGQSPDALFIACCDSRVVPNAFASTDPGKLFVLRNIGNLVPPFSSNEDHSAAAAIEYAVKYLHVDDIVVCGHSECGAMKAICDNLKDPTSKNLMSWLEHGEASTLNKHADKIDASLSKENQLSQENVLEQLNHLRSYPYVEELISAGKLRLHAWWFDIANADVYCFEESHNKYVLIDEREAKIILARL